MKCFGHNTQLRIYSKQPVKAQRAILSLAVPSTTTDLQHPGRLHTDVHPGNPIFFIKSTIDGTKHKALSPGKKHGHKDHAFFKIYEYQRGAKLSLKYAHLVNQSV